MKFNVHKLYSVDKSSRLLSDLVEFSGTSKSVFDVWCC